MRRILTAITMLSAPALFAASNGAWMKHVPAQEQSRANPYAHDTNAVAAGAILYQRSCASCHGDDAAGIGRHPNLRTERVHNATDGQIFWLLTNGELAHGMPSWSRLPEGERWQLVRYLHSLPLNAAR